MFYLPSYHFIDNLLLLGTATTQIDTGSFYTFMPHQISKQGYVIELIQKILCKAVTERVRVNHFLIQAIFCSIIFQLLSNTSGSDTFTETIKEKITSGTIDIWIYSPLLIYTGLLFLDHPESLSRIRNQYNFEYPLYVLDHKSPNNYCSYYNIGIHQPLIHLLR